MRWAKPLRLHLSVLVASLLLFISAVLVWLAFSQGREAALLAGEKQMRLMSLRLVEGYKHALEGGYEAVSLATTLPQLASSPPLDLEKKQAFFFEILRNVTTVNSILVGYPDGSYIQALHTVSPQVRATLSAPENTAFALRLVGPESRPGAGPVIRFLDADGRVLAERPFGDPAFDPRKRPWYRAVLRYGKPVSVGPFISGTLKVPTLTMAAPLKDNSQIVVGVNIYLDTVRQLIGAGTISPRARSYILDEQDNLVAHSDPVIMGSILGAVSQTGGNTATGKSLDKTVNAIVRLRKDPNAANGDMIRFDIDGERFVAVIAPVAVSDLFKGSAAAVVVPLDDLLSDANRQLTRNLMMAAAFVAASIGVSILLARMISASLYRLADEARKIGDLDFAASGEPHSMISEINTLASALSASRRAIAQFALYVPREVVRRIIDPTDRSTGAARQDVTALFTDISDFTTISERLSPEDVVEILTTYFEQLNRIAEDHGGTVVQYLGDSIFVMWNAPIHDPDHVAKACRCALAMTAAIDRLNESNERTGRPKLQTRFGIHTGQAVVGSFGAISRRQYTAMGDTINVASRLEGLNKEFGTTILASTAVRTAVADRFAFRDIGPVKIKGRNEPVGTCELVSALDLDR